MAKARRNAWEPFTFSFIRKAKNQWGINSGRKSPWCEHSVLHRFQYPLTPLSVSCIISRFLFSLFPLLLERNTFFVHIYRQLSQRNKNEDIFQPILGLLVQVSLQQSWQRKYLALRMMGASSFICTLTRFKTWATFDVELSLPYTWHDESKIELFDEFGHASTLELAY